LIFHLPPFSNWLLLSLGTLLITDVVLTTISVLRLRKRWQELLARGEFHLLRAHLSIQEQLSNLPQLSFNHRRLLKTFRGLGDDFLQSLKKRPPATRR
jgi:hypothetical protein